MPITQAMCDITMPTQSEFTCAIGDQIQVDGGVVVKIMGTAGQSARIGVGAPASVQILRTELVGRDLEPARRDLGGSRAPGENG